MPVSCRLVLEELFIKRPACSTRNLRLRQPAKRLVIKKVSNCQKIKVSFPYVEIENYTRFYIGIKSTLVFPDMGNKIPLIVKQIICFVRRSQWQQPLLCQSGQAASVEPHHHDQIGCTAYHYNRLFLKILKPLSAPYLIQYRLRQARISKPHTAPWSKDGAPSSMEDRKLSHVGISQHTSYISIIYQLRTYGWCHLGSSLATTDYDRPIIHGWIWCTKSITKRCL